MKTFLFRLAKNRTAATLAVACLLLGARPAAFAISKAPATPAGPQATPQLPTIPDASAPAQQNEATALSKIVGRLAARENRTARDWAELGRETVTWGSRLQSQQQPVPEGPVRDALTAVDLGAKLDKSAADWPKLREELETLLKKPEDEKEQDKQKQQQQQQNPQDKNEQQQNQDQQKQDQNKSDQQKQQNDSQKQNEQEKNQQSSGEQPQQKQEPKPQGESAFGDMTKKDEPPPPPPESMQKVGGAPEKKEEQKEPLDPALALPMQKLEQLKNQDSPAQLFQLMEGEKKPTKKTGKDW